jgi:molybdenum cofactor guanylyltransferase
MSAPCTGVILAGGRASRYGGRPKGLERVHGTRVIDRVADALRSVSDSLLLIANDPGAEAWLPDVRVAGDVRPGVGSLGGIHAALVRAGTAVLVVAWDMPFVPEGLLTELRALGDDADVAAPESGSRRGHRPHRALDGRRRPSRDRILRAGASGPPPGESGIALRRSGAALHECQLT